MNLLEMVRTTWKSDNCPVAVFATFGHGRFAPPIDCLLYLSHEWTETRGALFESEDTRNGNSLQKQVLRHFVWI